MSYTIYCYPDSDVLKNRMGIRGIDRLRLLDDFNEYYYEGMYQLAADRKEL